MNKSILDGAVVYLGGPIDRAFDDGLAWRIAIKKDFEAKGIQLVCLDPTNKFVGIKGEVGEEKIEQQILREKEDWHGLKELVKPIVRMDLRMVDLCDILIAKIDVNVHMCGTYHEIVVAIQEKKPILLIIEGGKKNCPGWLFGVIDHEFMFDSIEECLNYLDQVNRGETILDDKWVLIRPEIKKLESQLLK